MMPVRRILQLGEPLLRAVSAPVAEAATPAGLIAALIEDLRDTLHAFQRANGFGRGISAVQIGVALRVIYMEVDDRCYPLINPEVVFLSDQKFQLWDDCFSIPNTLVRVERSQTVRLVYRDEAGASQTLEASGAFSELIQHETDHLDGILNIDRALNAASIRTFEPGARFSSSNEV